MKLHSPAQTATRMGICAAAVLGFLVLPLASQALAAKTTPSQRQVTLGGAKYFVKGTVTKIQEDTYWIETPSGDTRRVEVNESTDMICPSRDEKTTVKSPMGAGFRIGDCPFRVGEMVKAEVSDIGTATFMREAEDIPAARTAELGLPRDYTVLPIWPHSMFQTTKISGYTVKNLEGEKIGTLSKVIIDATTGEPAYGIVELHNGSLMPVPYQGLKISSEKNTMGLQMSRENLVYAPTFEQKVSVPQMQAFWEREFDNYWDPAVVRPYEDQWVKNVVDSLQGRPSLREALSEHPGAPTQWISLLNRSAKALNDGQDAVAKDYFSHALHAVDEAVERERFPKAAAHRVKSAMVLHAPGQLSSLVRDGVRHDPSIAMEEAINIARNEWSGKVINADYLGDVGENLYRIEIMAGTGVTRLIEVDGDTGEIEKSVIVAGHVMPDEPFR